MSQTTTFPTEKAEHKGLPSASAFGRYELCPGSWQLERKAAELGQSALGDSEAAARGTRIHGWLAGEDVTLSSEELETAEFLLERASEQRERIFEGAEVYQLTEKRLWMKVEGRLIFSGRFDRVLYSPKVALVQDFKTGWSEPVAAELSAQMKVLAVLVAVSLTNLEEVVVQVISGPYGVSEARFNLAQLAQAYNEVAGTLAAIADPMAPLVPSPQACRFCPARAICQALKDSVVPVISRFSALPEGGQRAARLLDEITVLESHFEAIRAFYSERLTRNPAYDLPGYAMVPGSARREISDWPAAVERLSQNGVEPDQLGKALSYRLGDLEKALGARLKLKGKALKEKFNQILTGLIEEKQNKPSLKRVSGTPKIQRIQIP